MRSMTSGQRANCEIQGWKHARHVNKHSSADCGTTCTVSPLLASSLCFSLTRCCLSCAPLSLSLCLLSPSHSLFKHFLSTLHGSLFSWNHFIPITMERGGSKHSPVTHRCLFGTQCLFVCSVNSVKFSTWHLMLVLYTHCSHTVNKTCSRDLFWKPLHSDVESF